MWWGAREAILLLTLSVFVGEHPPVGEEARTVRAVAAVAARFAGEVEVVVLPIDGPQGTALGLTAGPVVVEGETVLSVGGLPSAGRLKRYLEAQLGAQSDAADATPGG